MLDLCNIFQKTSYVPQNVLGSEGHKEVNQFSILISANEQTKKTSDNIIEQFRACAVEVTRLRWNPG